MRTLPVLVSVLLALGAASVPASAGGPAHGAPDSSGTDPSSPAATTPAATGAELVIIAPLTVPPSAEGLIDAETLESYTAPGGLLSMRLEQLWDSDVTVAIDPRIILSIRALGDTASAEITDWLTRLAALPRASFALAYADADLVLAATAAEGAVPGLIDFALDPALFAPVDPPPTADPDTPPAEGDGAPRALERLEWGYSLRGIAWPTAGTVTMTGLELLAAAGHTTALVSSAQLGEARGAVTSGGHRLLSVDDRFSSLLDAAVSAPTIAEWETAMDALGTALEATGSGTVVVALDRVPATAYRLSLTLSALQERTGVSLGSLAGLLGASGPEIRLLEAEPDESRLATARRVVEAEGAITRFSSLLEDPAWLTGPRRLDLLATLSNGWSGDAGWSQAVADNLAAGTEITSAVTVPDSSMITFPLDSGNLPITVGNALNRAVTVYVAVRPDRPILTVGQAFVELQIEANSQAKAFIPVVSVANGEVQAEVVLRSRDASWHSEPVVVQVNVQAGWETAATVVVAGFVVLLFAAGVWRTIRRVRSRAS